MAHKMITVQHFPDGFKEFVAPEGDTLFIDNDGPTLVVSTHNGGQVVAIYAPNTWVSAIGSEEKDETP